MISRGLLITIEGGEAVGKSTQLLHLAERLRGAGHCVVTTREPGGTPGAEAIRGVMLDPATVLDPLADTLLVFAARADHVAHLIRPALMQGKIVLCDRYVDSTLAYQGYGLGVDLTSIRLLSSMIGLDPDLTFILDLSPDSALARLSNRQGALDRYERFTPAFAARVAAGFRAIAMDNPHRCLLIDAAAEIENITRLMFDAIQTKLGRP